MTVPFYPKRELPRRIREALSKLDPADAVKTTSWIVDEVDELDMAPVWSAMTTLLGQGFVELVSREATRAESTWRPTELARCAPKGIKITRQQAKALAAIQRLGGAATSAEVAKALGCVEDTARMRVRRLRKAGVLSIQEGTSPMRYVLP